MDNVPYIIQQTELFASWHRGLPDLKARIAVARRVERAAAGNLGDVKSVGKGVSEMRIDVGAGYRAYFTMRGDVVVILPCGGDKKTQRRDIQRAAQLAKEV